MKFLFNCFAEGSSRNPSDKHSELCHEGVSIAFLKRNIFQSRFPRTKECMEKLHAETDFSILNVKKREMERQRQIMAVLKREQEMFDKLTNKNTDYKQKILLDQAKRENIEKQRYIVLKGQDE